MRLAKRVRASRRIEKDSLLFLGVVLQKFPV